MAKTRKKEKVKLTRRMVNEVSFEHLQAVRSLEKVKNYDRVFAEIAATRRLESLHALGYKKSSGKPCIHRLLAHKTCLRSDVRADGCWPPAADHVTLWLRDGKPAMLVSQPYGLRYEDLKATVEYAEENGLRVFIDAALSWHYASATLAVILTRKGEYHPSKRGNERARQSIVDEPDEPLDLSVKVFERDNSD